MSEEHAVAPTGIRVLIAEDEALIARLIMFILEDAGISSKIVLSGYDAVEAISADPTGFQILVTDIRVGHPPDGWGVAEIARKANPNIGVIYITGDSMGDWPSKGVADSLLLAKPFLSRQVLAAVKSLAPV